MTTGIYLRISTDRQDSDNQLADLQRYCNAMGYTDVIIYSDTASGAKADRTEFKRMLDDARKKRITRLLFWSLDRISRQGTLETLQYLRLLDDAGCAWHSFMEPYLDNTGMFRDAVIGIVSCVAKIERQRIKDRTAASIQRRRDLGQPLGRPKAIFNREQVRQLRAEGMSVRLLAKKFQVGVGTIHRTLAVTAENSGTVLAS